MADDELPTITLCPGGDQGASDNISPIMLKSQSSSSFVIRLEEECIRWESLRDRTLSSPKFKNYRTRLNGENGSPSVDEVFISLLLDRLETDLDQDDKLRPYEPQRAADSRPCKSQFKKSAHSLERRKSSRVSNGRTRTASMMAQGEGHSHDVDLTKRTIRTKRSRVQKVKMEGTQFQSDERTEESKHPKPELQVKTEIIEPASNLKESSKTAGGKGYSSKVCAAPSLMTKAPNKKTRPRIPKPRKVVLEKQGSRSKGSKENATIEEAKVKTKRKRGRPEKDINDDEREAIIFNKRLKEMQHQDLPKMFTCRTCEEQFQESDILRMHTITAHLPISIQDDNEDPSKEEGEIRFTHIEIDLSLYQQVNEVDIQELAIVLKCCPQCNKYVEDLKAHLETHMVKNYICEDCGKGFACDKQLKVHVGYHEIDRTGVMPYSCNFCDRTFRTMQALCIHRPLHNKARNYVCEHCGKAFKANGRLQKHIGTHMTQKRFSCSFCGRGFAQKCNMNRHLRTHTGEKPYCCHHCNQVFNHNISLKRHMKRDHFIDVEDAVQQPVQEVENFPSGRMPIHKNPP